MYDFWSDPSSTSILHVCEQWSLWWDRWMRRHVWAFAGPLCDKYHNSILHVCEHRSFLKFHMSHVMRLWHFPSPLNVHVQPYTGVRCLIFGWPFFYFHTSCVWTVKSLMRLRGCAGTSEPSLVAYVTSTIISWAGLFHFFCLSEHFTVVWSQVVQVQLVMFIVTVAWPI